LQEIILKIKDLLSCAVRKCESDSIALSGGLDSSILASRIKNKESTAITIIAQDFPSTDLLYAQLSAKVAGLKLNVVKVDTDELLDATEQTIKILKVFNPIEIRNNVVVYLVMKTAKQDGYGSVMMGDGADELFAGYNFFKRLSGKELDKDLERIWDIMHFPSRDIANSVGISIDSPYLEKKMSDYARKIPSSFKIRKEKGKKYGKWILRKAFENYLPKSIIWREKSAMQDGSGTSGITYFLDNLIPDTIFNEKSKYYFNKEKVILGSKESLYYYQIFRKFYDINFKVESSKTKCPKCNYPLKFSSHFCRMCGSYPI
jgi:asparagine synthase (glutamine-hydrolysing)